MKVSIMNKLVRLWYLHRHYRKKAIEHFQAKKQEQKINAGISNTMSKYQVFDSTSVKNPKFNKANLSKSAIIIKKEEDKIEIDSDK